MCAHCWATYVLGKLQYHGQGKAQCASLDERMQPKLRDRQTQHLVLNQVFSLPPSRSGKAEGRPPECQPCHMWSSIEFLMKNGRAISALQIEGPFIYYLALLKMSINFFSKQIHWKQTV